MEVIIGRDYGESLFYHVKLNAVRMEIEYAKCREENGAKNSKHIKKLEQKENNLGKQVNKEMEKLDANNLAITNAYVVFNKVNHKLECLETYKKFGSKIAPEYKLG